MYASLGSIYDRGIWQGNGGGGIQVYMTDNLEGCIRGDIKIPSL